MSKEYTSYLKGVAILLMVCLHLFKPSNDIYELGNIFSIGGVPLVGYLTRMCNPVPFFLILSGYGLYAVYGKLGGGESFEKGRESVCSPMGYLFDICATWFSCKA